MVLFHMFQCFLALEMSESDFKFLKFNVHDFCFEIYMISEEYKAVMTGIGKFFSFLCFTRI